MIYEKMTGSCSFFFWGDHAFPPAAEALHERGAGNIAARVVVAIMPGICLLFLSRLSFLHFLL